MIRKIAFFLALTAPALAANVDFLIMPDQVSGPISPYVYGLNTQKPGDLNATVRRLGGNRMTTYNWENNASNAGTDWHNTSDDWMCAQNLGYTDCDQPGAMVKDFVAEDEKDGMASLVTIPMAGYVAADKDGEVTEKETAPSRRWDRVYYHKRGPYRLKPDLRDRAVYEDEFVHFLTANFKKAGQGGVGFYELDNEPSLWPTTHPRVHPAKTRYWELINRTERAAFNILRVDPTAMIFGPVLYGWQSYLTLQDAPDSAFTDQSQGTFIDFYLKQMAYLERHDGRRLLDVLDLHWYPEATGNGKRITLDGVSPASREARLQAPRSLWDPGYVEKSWITRDSTKGKPIRLIPWLQEKIDRDYPGTKLAFTEYDFGAGADVSGGLAQADALGIFGKYGVFMANYWGDLKAYNRAAFKLYRNYDGKDGRFGDTSVSAGTQDVSETSIYASTDDKRPGWLWVVALNKDLKNPVQGKFTLQGKETYDTYQAYAFDAQSPDIQPAKQGKLEKNGFDYSLPPLSATLFVCHQVPEAPAAPSSAAPETPAATAAPGSTGN